MLPTLRRQTPIVREEPFESLWQDFAQMLDRWGWPEPSMQDGMTASYPVDVSEENGKIFVEAELPGFQKKEISVSMRNGVLDISAERKEEQKKHKQHLHERRYTHVQRRLTLPAEVDESKVVAKFEDGVLRLELPKSAKAKESTIAIS